MKTGAKFSIDKIVLAEYCLECGGEGMVGFDQDFSNPERVCTYCDGLGYTVTEAGSQILALVDDILLKGRK